VVEVMSNSDSYNANDEAIEQLVAYLDGELDAESTRQVERRLAEDVDYRRELKHLQRAWDLLDDLPRAEASETFTQTTVEMVALSAAADLETAQGDERRQHRWRWAIGVSGTLVAGLAGYLLISSYLSRPNSQLVRDLPVIENVDVYRVADSVEFLRQLDQAGLFNEEVDDAQ
jgi:anti-sigma factor RsiW